MVFIPAEKLSGIAKADGGGRCSQSRGVRGKKTKLMPEEKAMQESTKGEL